MPLQDWTKAETEIFHSMHLAWIAAISKLLNRGMLPEGYYSLAESHAGCHIDDVMVLRRQGAIATPSRSAGAISVTDNPPSVQMCETLAPSLRELRRTLTIRHISTHRVIALLEIVSPGNKDREEHIEEFVIKTITALERGVHVVVVDLFPPGAHDADGIHGEMRRRLVPLGDPFELPADQPQTLVSYVSGRPTEVYLNHMAVGEAIPETPLFLNRDRYINLPLESTYLSAYGGMPSFWQDVLEGRIRD